MKNQVPPTVSASVMDAIKSGKVHMKPRAYYTLLGIVSGAVVLLAGTTTAYLTSIVVLWIRIQTAGTSAYGARAKLSESISTFPWWALALAAALLVVAIVLVRRHGHMYKHKIATVALVLITCSLLLGLGLSFFDVGKSHVPNRQHDRGPGQSWQQNR